MNSLQEDLVVNTEVFKEVWYTGNFVEIQGSLIIVNKGFEWDGCTCAKDQPSNRIACCVHDALLWDNNIPITRWEKDKVFYKLLKENKFKLGGWVPFSPEIYYIGVTLATVKVLIFKRLKSSNN